MKPGTLVYVALVFLAGAAHGNPTLNIVIYGATGEVGSHIVREALQRGHHVTAVSRKPEQVDMQHDRLAVVKGDLLDKASVTEIVTGKDIRTRSDRQIRYAGKCLTVYRRRSARRRTFPTGRARTAPVACWRLGLT